MKINGMDIRYGFLKGPLYAVVHLVGFCCWFDRRFIHYICPWCWGGEEGRLVNIGRMLRKSRWSVGE